LRNSAKIAIASVVALAALAGMVVIAVNARHDDTTTGHFAFAPTQPAGAPFAAFAEARVGVGQRCLRVLVATTEAQRVQGLRDVTNLAPYDGIVFVFPRDTSAQFTMANTPMPLDIAFFDAHGNPVDSSHMTPCPHGTDASCPAYASKHKYRTALETPSSGAHGGGALGPCAA
jgi:hypothetical protein